MEFITELWLAIVLSAVFVFIVSSIMHMVLPFHRSDYSKVDGEDAILETMRSNSVQPGSYMFPHARSMKDMQSPEMVEKFKTGPVGWMTVLAPHQFNMGRSLALWFVFILVANVFIAYGAWNGLGPTAEYLTVFRVVGTLSCLAFALGVVNDSIWKGQAWSTSFKFVFDGLVYALVTAGTYGWLWPEAMSNLPTGP